MKKVIVYNIIVVSKAGIKPSSFYFTRKDIYNAIGPNFRNANFAVKTDIETYEGSNIHLKALEGDEKAIKKLVEIEERKNNERAMEEPLDDE